MDDREDETTLCLVTGGAGFVGRALVARLLAEGFRVRTLDVRPCYEDEPRVEHLVADLRDYAAVQQALSGVDTVFHTAAVINLLGVVDGAQRQEVMDINVGGAQNLVRACHTQGVPRLVYTSTNNVSFDREILGGDEQERYAETFVDLYTESKVASEKAILTADKVRGLRTVALRPGGIWGPSRGAYMMEKFLKELAEGKLVASIGDGSAMADNTHVDNLVDAQLLALDALKDRPEVVGGQAYYVTDDEPMNAVEWYRPLVEDLGFEMPKVRLPGRAMYPVAWGLEWLHRLGGPRPLLTRIEVLKVSRSHTFRIDKARRDLGYEPRRKRDEGLRECVPYARRFVADARDAAARS